MQHDKQPSSYVWLAAESGSGWSLGTQFMIGLAGPVIAFMPLDGAAHLVADVNRPAVIVPKTIMASLVISFLSALVFVLAVLYSISDVTSVLTSPSGFVLFELWRQATGSTAPAIAFTISIIIMLPIGSIACQQVASMMALSLGLDKALVFPDTWGTLNKKLNTPVNALLLNSALMFLVGILFLVSTLGASTPPVHCYCVIWWLTSNSTSVQRLDWDRHSVTANHSGHPDRVLAIQSPL